MTTTLEPQSSRYEPITIGPYGASHHRPFRSWRWWITPALAAFCFVYGFFFALTAPYLIVAFVAPLGVLAIAVIWALPDLKSAPTGPMTGLLMAFIVCLFAWPNYIALALPGLPWITLIRLTGVPMTIILLICLSVSRQFRSTLGETINTIPLLWKCLAGLVALQFLTIPFSDDISTSLQRSIVSQSNWTAVFVVSCFAFRKQARIERYALILWALVLFICAMSLVEATQRKVLWQGHIPSFLKIEDAETILKPSTRSATGLYRVKAIFTTPLGLSEFLALIVPFNLHFVLGRYNPFIRALSAATLPLMIYVIMLTDSRLGLVGSIIGVMGYFCLWSIIRWRKNQRGIFGAALVFAYPAIFCTAVAATFLIGRLKQKVWGGGAQQASNNAREAQLDRGIPIVLKSPWGHGNGQSGHALGFYSNGNFLTIDNYYLLVALEYGLLGIVLFFIVFGVSIFYGAKYAIVSMNMRDRDMAFLIPITASLAAFFVIKSVFSQPDNHPLIFMMLGALVALIYRIQTALRVPTASTPVSRK